MTRRLLFTLFVLLLPAQVWADTPTKTSAHACVQKSSAFWAGHVAEALMPEDTQLTTWKVLYNGRPYLLSAGHHSAYKGLSIGWKANLYMTAGTPFIKVRVGTATIVAVTYVPNKGRDIAIMIPDAPIPKLSLSRLALGNSQALFGRSVAVVAFPFGHYEVARGEIGTQFDPDYGEPYSLPYQQPGASGAPVFDCKTNLVVAMRTLVSGGIDVGQIRKALHKVDQTLGLLPKKKLLSN